MIAGALTATGIGALAEAHPLLLVEIGLAAAVIFLFLRWPYTLLLLVLATAFKDNQALELFVVVGGGVAVATAGRRALRSPPAVLLLLLLLIALPRLPLTPTFADGMVASHLYVPFTGNRVAYLGSVSLELIAWWRLAFVLVAYVLARWLVRNRRRLQQVVAAILLGAVYPILDGLAQYARGQFVVRPGTTSKSIEGPFTHPNYFGFFLLVVVVVALVTMIEARSRRVQTALVLFIAAGSTCLFLTYTRSAWFGLVGALVVLGLLRFRVVVLAIALGALVGAVAFPGVVTEVRNRLTSKSTATSNNSDSYAWRRGEWDRMVPYGLKHPWTGTGFSSYAADTVKVFGTQDRQYPTITDTGHPEQSPKGFSAHNDYVRMLVELGFPGLVLWCLVLLSMVASLTMAARAPGVRGLAVGLVSIFVALMVISYSDNVQGYTIDLLLPFTLAGAVTSVARSERRAAETAVDGPIEQLPEAATDRVSRMPPTPGMLIAGASPTLDSLGRLARALATDGVTAEVVDAWRKVGIEAVLIKGPTVANWLYDDDAVRGYNDSDLLISPADVALAQRVLGELGFDEQPYPDPDTSKHATPWVRARDGAVVDLHHRLWGAWGPTAQQQWDRLLFGWTETAIVGGRPVLVPTKPGRLMLIALHAAQHSELGGKPREDLRRAIERADRRDWRAASVLAEAIGACREMVAGLATLREGTLLASELPLLQAVLRDDRQLPQIRRREALAARGAATLLAEGLGMRESDLRRRYPIARRGPLGRAAAAFARLLHVLGRAPGVLLDVIRAR